MIYWLSTSGSVVQLERSEIDPTLSPHVRRALAMVQAERFLLGDAG